MFEGTARQIQAIRKKWRTGGVAYANRPNYAIPAGNLVSFPDDLTNALWVKTAASIGANAITAPDGTLTADKLIEDITNANHLATTNVPVSALSPYTVSCCAKAAGRTQVQMQFYDGVTNIFPVFSLLDGSLVTGGGVGAYTATNIGNGWWRFTFVATSGPAVTNASIYLYPAAGGTNVYTGDGSSGVYIWHALIY